MKRTVRAGQKVQVEVEVKAASAGTFPVRLALFTPSGQPLGTPAQVLVRSTTYGVVATIFTDRRPLAAGARGAHSRGTRPAPTLPARSRSDYAKSADS